MAEGRLTLDQEQSIDIVLNTAKRAFYQQSNLRRLLNEVRILRSELAASEQARKEVTDWFASTEAAWRKASVNFEREIAERDRHVSQLEKQKQFFQQALNEPAEKLESFRQQLAERDSRIAELEKQRDAKQINHEVSCTVFGSGPCTCGFSPLRERNAQLQSDCERLTKALQRLVKTCPRGCSDGKIGNAGSGYMECPACGPLRRALSVPSAQQAQERIAAMEELEAAVRNATQYVGTDSGLSPTTGEMERLTAALQRWRETSK